VIQEKRERGNGVEMPCGKRRGEEGGGGAACVRKGKWDDKRWVSHKDSIRGGGRGKTRRGGLTSRLTFFFLGKGAIKRKLAKIGR